jgi:hypothetical protein
MKKKFPRNFKNPRKKSEKKSRNLREAIKWNWQRINSPPRNSTDTIDYDTNSNAHRSASILTDTSGIILSKRELILSKVVKVVKRLSE